VTHDPQAQFELNDIIDYLVARKFRPDKDEGFPSISTWLTRPATIASFFDDNKEKLAYKAQLTNMSTEKLTTLLADVNATEDTETKAWAKLQDQTKFFNEPRAQADHDFWSMMPLWDLDEATALSFDKDPHIVNWPISGRM
jgi:hypothetical protein